MSAIELWQIRLADFELPDFHPEAPGNDTVYGFVVRDGDACILVDTGIGTGNSLIDRWYKPRRVDLEQALGEVGVSIADITGVVNTHLHFDHCGSNYLFAGVPIFIQAAELEAAHQPRYTIVEWVDFPGANYVPIHGAHALSENLQLIATSGHTPGHQSLLVRSPERVDIIVGQAAYTSTEFGMFCRHREEDAAALNRCIESNATWSRDAYVASLDVLERVRAHRAFFSHDVRTWVRER